jgi:hypothetical protein
MAAVLSPSLSFRACRGTRLAADTGAWQLAVHASHLQQKARHDVRAHDRLGNAGRHRDRERRQGGGTVGDGVPREVRVHQPNSGLRHVSSASASAPAPPTPLAGMRVRRAFSARCAALVFLFVSLSCGMPSCMTKPSKMRSAPPVSARTRRKMALRSASERAHLARLSAGCLIARCRSARPRGRRAGGLSDDPKRGGSNAQAAHPAGGQRHDDAVQVARKANGCITRGHTARRARQHAVPQQVHKPHRLRPKPAPCAERNTADARPVAAKGGALVPDAEQHDNGVSAFVGRSRTTHRMPAREGSDRFRSTR